MQRNEFLKLSAFAGGILATSGFINGESSSGKTSSKGLTAAALQKFLTSLTELGEKTVDRIIIGNPDCVVRKIGTCWMPDWKTCKKAVEAGVNVLVAHEPTFYTHWDLDEKNGDFFITGEYNKNQYLKLIGEKRKWILDNELVIIRNHDTMDALKDIGIPFAFGQFLGYSNSDIIASRKYYNVYKVPSQPAESVARHIAGKLARLNQPGIAFYGDLKFPVSSVGLGTGCICDPMEFADLNPDIFIAIDDTVKTWTQTSYATDSGHPLIVINHGTSEEMGMRALNKLIKARFPDIDTIHFEQGCSYKWITV